MVAFCAALAWNVSPVSSGGGSRRSRSDTSSSLTPATISRISTSLPAFEVATRSFTSQCPRDGGQLLLVQLGESSLCKRHHGRELRRCERALLGRPLHLEQLSRG